MAFEVKSTGPTGASGRRGSLTGAFADGDWAGLLALAREHGFDPGGEYEELLYPPPGEVRELRLAAAQELAVALSEAARRETASPGEGGSEDDTQQLGWVYDPERGWERTAMIRVGPSERPELQVGWVHTRQLGELAETGSIEISRAPEPTEQEEEP